MADTPSEEEDHISEESEAEESESEESADVSTSNEDLVRIVLFLLSVFKQLVNWLRGEPQKKFTMCIYKNHHP